MAGAESACRVNAVLALQKAHRVGDDANVVHVFGMGFAAAALACIPRFHAIELAFRGIAAVEVGDDEAFTFGHTVHFQVLKHVARIASTAMQCHQHRALAWWRQVRGDVHQKFAPAVAQFHQIARERAEGFLADDLGAVFALVLQHLRDALAAVSSILCGLRGLRGLRGGWECGAGQHGSQRDAGEMCIHGAALWVVERASRQRIGAM